METIFCEATIQLAKKLDNQVCSGLNVSSDIVIQSKNLNRILSSFMIFSSNAIQSMIDNYKVLADHLVEALRIIELYHRVYPNDQTINYDQLRNYYSHFKLPCLSF